ncbi:hypothetical protein [Brytella acorum]|uniref:Uncharacterized protein n=1 Tax=Brytella acorum TaxID=2959299 RepID=A0AA35Y367_9PROT|nr:hypothetical protein [Brytella acorum]MDF3623419.1 hypothetical protein [Brytella acorum]CAI9120526.1 hypothetical protein LMG32879_001359 [Brytella acorum]
MDEHGLISLLARGVRARVAPWQCVGPHMVVTEACLKAHHGTLCN